MAWLRRMGRPHAGPDDGAEEIAGERVGSHRAVPEQRRAIDAPGRVTVTRLGESLQRENVRFLADAEGALLAMWERHALLFALEGPDDEILVMRARAHCTVPPDWADRAYAAVNEWNHSNRFVKGYVADPAERGRLPVYGEIQVPLTGGVPDELLDEWVRCAVRAAAAFVDWLHDDGALL